MTWQEIVDKARESIQCPRCGMAAGQRCVTKSGHWASRQHHARTRPIQEAWVAGLEEARNDVLDAYLDSTPWFERMVARRRKERAS